AGQAIASMRESAAEYAGTAVFATVAPQYGCPQKPSSMYWQSLFTEHARALSSAAPRASEPFTSRRSHAEGERLEPRLKRGIAAIGPARWGGRSSAGSEALSSWAAIEGGDCNGSGADVVGGSGDLTTAGGSAGLAGGGSVQAAQIRGKTAKAATRRGARAAR